MITPWKDQLVMGQNYTIQVSKRQKVVDFMELYKLSSTYGNVALTFMIQNRCKFLKELLL